MPHPPARGGDVSVIKRFSFPQLVSGEPIKDGAAVKSEVRFFHHSRAAGEERGHVGPPRTRSPPRVAVGRQQRGRNFLEKSRRFAALSVLCPLAQQPPASVPALQTDWDDLPWPGIKTADVQMLVNLITLLCPI
ncbi:hypothetical protein AGIG_G8926 [Arapaima gigas]